MKLKNLIILFLIITIAISCNKKLELHEEKFPIIITNPITTITDTGIVASCTIKKTSAENIIEYGFIWSDNQNILTLDTSTIAKFSTKQILEDDYFEAAINYDVFTNNKYYLRAYVKTENYTTYGNIVNFIAEGCNQPIINSISPSSAGIGAPITISGNYFSYISIKLKFGNNHIKIDSSTNNNIYFKVPYTTDTICEIDIQINSTYYTVTDNFRILTEWKRKANFDGDVRLDAVGFLIGNKGYVGLGIGWGSHNDLWEYNPENDTWTQKADFGTTEREGAVGFSIGNKGYIGTGNEDYHVCKKDFWEYNPETNQWTQKADFGGNARKYAVCFSIENKGYIGTGYDEDNYKKDFWEYNPETDTWTQKSDFGGTARRSAVGFSINNKGYIGTGYEDNNVCKKDFWEYNPETNTWTQKANYKGPGIFGAINFSIGNKAYVGISLGNYGYDNSFWEFDPNPEN